ADALDLADAGVRCADDEEAIEEVVDVGLGRRRHRHRVALLDALVVVAQAERDAHVPAGLLGGRPGIGDAVCDVHRALDADLQRVRWRDLGDGLVEEPAELGQALDRDAEPAGEHVEPAADGRLQRIGALRRDPDRRMAFRGWWRGTTMTAVPTRSLVVFAAMYVASWAGRDRYPYVEK